MSSRVSPSALILLATALGVECYLAFTLVVLPQFMPSLLIWFTLHLGASLSTAIAVLFLLTPNTRKRSWPKVIAMACSIYGKGNSHSNLAKLVFYLSLTIPFAGALGSSAALIVGRYYSRLRHREPVYWEFTDNASLPFTAPVGRVLADIDSRSLTEQITFSDNTQSLYNKVLAAGRIRTSLSVEPLKRAVRHPDERISLTAYQALNKKVSHLNLAIQRLEREAATREGEDKSNTWLQIASYYWELLTLEKDEPVARKQLLDKAADAAFTAISISSDNCNAHFTLGRVTLLQRKPKVAAAAFRRAIELGMPSEKAVPYLAEAAFDQRKFDAVGELLEGIDPAFTAYPPLSHVARYWS